jgi:hypothetical protein
VRRREFITLLGGAAAWPLAARAQPASVHRIAIVRPSGSVAEMTEAGDNPSYTVLFKELRRLGYIERQNLSVERYSTEGHRERYTELAREVVRTKPHLIVGLVPLGANVQSSDGYGPGHRSYGGPRRLRHCAKPSATGGQHHWD